MPDRPTMEVSDLLRMYVHVDHMDRNQRAMWACIVMSFRSLLRKSNLVTSSAQDCHVLKRSAVIPHPWGILVRVSSTKTIQYGQRILELPIAYAHGSPLCAVFWLGQHLRDFPVSTVAGNLFVLDRKGVLVDMS